MAVKLYWFPLSHPAQAVRVALQRKGVEHELVHVLPGNQRVHLRLARFPGGTVPAVAIDGKRVQGSRQIMRALDELWPEPPLYPGDPQQRSKVEEAERWGDEALQSVSRRIMRWGLTRNHHLRRWMAQAHSSLPLPDVAAVLSAPLSRYYAGVVGANADAVRRDLQELPALLDEADRLLADGVLELEPPNAAALQVLSSVRALLGFADLAPVVERNACAAPARALFPEFPPDVAPPFLPADWLEPLHVRA